MTAVIRIILRTTMAMMLMACAMAHGAWAVDAVPDGVGRDPTELPSGLRPAPMAAVPGAIGARPAMAEPAPQPFFIMSQGGRLVVVHKAHRLNVGDELGNARIARIDSDAVWLRESGQVTRTPIYPNVTKRPAAQPAKALSPLEAASSVSRHRRFRTMKKDAP